MTIDIDNPVYRKCKQVHIHAKLFKKSQSNQLAITEHNATLMQFPISQHVTSFHQTTATILITYTIKSLTQTGTLKNARNGFASEKEIVQTECSTIDSPSSLALSP